MAQIGSFVPATSATIGVVDRIFTRVGLQDDLTVGQSTFMVEMVETANNLPHATARRVVEKAAAVLRDEMGIEPLRGIFSDGEWKQTFINPRDSGGVLYQLFIVEVF